MTDQVIHFSIGPVQSFVSQARRTRDLWAGSFLLSWFSGQAMAEFLGIDGASIAFPSVMEKGEVVDPMLADVLASRNKQPIPHNSRIGSLPNRFKIIVPEDVTADQVKSVVSSIMGCWLELANIVFEQFIPTERQGDIKPIWVRQIKGFWAINWVMGSAGNDDSWLDYRKNWRNHWITEEGGEKCSLMPDYQELSGEFRSAKQRAFWQELRKHIGEGADRNIGINENLCAIAFVKRFFPQLPKKELIKTIGWVPGGDTNKLRNWPSTTYLAVSPWLYGLSNESQRTDALMNYETKVLEVLGSEEFRRVSSERAVELARLSPLSNQKLAGTKRSLDDLDGDLLHHHALANYRGTHLSSGAAADLSENPGKDPDAQERQKLLVALNNLYDSVGATPRSYFALLVFDGDSLGSLLRDEDAQAVSTALGNFTRNAENIVGVQHSGVTVYAGGDDVLALLPMDTALECAQDLNSSYKQCFQAQDISTATASCAVVFAHHQRPLKTLLEESNQLLKQKAKELNGRDSIVCAVVNPSGNHTEWLSKWGEDGEDGKGSHISKMIELVNGYRADEHFYPRGFFHKLREHLAHRGEAGTEVYTWKKEELKKLLVAEYMMSRDPRPSLSTAVSAVKLLLDASWQEEEKNGAGNLQLSAGVIARFLSRAAD